jgi:hypothetical protein
MQGQSSVDTQPATSSRYVLLYLSVMQSVIQNHSGHLGPQEVSHRATAASGHLGPQEVSHRLLQLLDSLQPAEEVEIAVAHTSIPPFYLLSELPGQLLRLLPVLMLQGLFIGVTSCSAALS